MANKKLLRAHEKGATLPGFQNPSDGSGEDGLMRVWTDEGRLMYSQHFQSKQTIVLFGPRTQWGWWSKKHWGKGPTRGGSWELGGCGGFKKVTFCQSYVSRLIDGWGCHFLRKGAWHEVGAGARGALSFGFMKREELELLSDSWRIILMYVAVPLFGD